LEEKKIFGDFQTPQPLANRLCLLLRELGIAPKNVVEPTCGIGAFLMAASEVFPTAQLTGRDISPLHIHVARKRLPETADLAAADFFETEWESFGRPNTLFLGNPPWVTSAELSRNQATNDPVRDNLKRLRGMDALTGKSNFDISEWMLLRLLIAAQKETSVVAMVCKSSVARKVLEFAATNRLAFKGHGFWRINAAHEFGASVECGFLVFEAVRHSGRLELPVFDDGLKGPVETWEWIDGILVRDGSIFRQHMATLGPPGSSDWRSGVKHDCREVLELEPDAGGWRNGRDEPADVEPDLVYPFLKATDLFHGREPRLAVLLTQETVGEDTTWIAAQLPKTWRYLEEHRIQLDSRKSRIYHGRPAFSVFGVGGYSFKPWKIALSGLHKEPRFRLVGPFKGRPVMLDDTSYFVGFDSEEQARAALSHLAQGHLQEILAVLAFPDNKRPFTKAILSRLRLPEPTEPQRDKPQSSQLSLNH
jgi:hypothetical protein